MNEIANVYGEKPAEITAASVTSAMATTRQAQEVQAAMIVAKRFPRDERESCNRILNACNRRSLAESAIYSFSRGGSEVTGPSIRLAECLAQNWGNIDFGYIELEQKNGESQVMAYAWDLETNTRQSKVFSVPHIRKTKTGAYSLTDPRDIYEMVANQASRSQPLPQPVLQPLLVLPQPQLQNNRIRMMIHHQLPPPKHPHRLLLLHIDLTSGNFFVSVNAYTPCYSG